MFQEWVWLYGFHMRAYYYFYRRAFSHIVRYFVWLFDTAPFLIVHLSLKDVDSIQNYIYGMFFY